ncbi:MAG: helix-turn-helix domain-containing protein [Nitrospinae bacterium]|nr:helix-turn-helix domain-containing protein [Nitrospinota bacterium]
MKDQIPKLIDQKRVAEIFGKSPAWCARARSQGDGPAFIKIGRHVRYELSDVLEWLKLQPKATFVCKGEGKR